MSYYKCNKISINKKENKIMVNVASNNCRPITYSNCELAKDFEKINDKLLFLFADLMSGNIHISSINSSTDKFEYALLKALEYAKENNIDTYSDIYIKRGEEYCKLFMKEFGIDRDKEWEKAKEIEANNKEKILKLELKSYEKAYGETFEIFKKALNEKNNSQYIIKTQYGSYIGKIGKYNEGYCSYYYGYNKEQAMKVNFRKAFIIKENLKSKNLIIEMI